MLKNMKCLIMAVMVSYLHFKIKIILKISEGYLEKLTETDLGLL